jgi:integrase
MLRQRFLPIHEWPAQDRLAWQVAIHAGGILDDGGPAAHLAPTTRNDMARRYGYFLGFAKRNGLLIRNGPAAASMTPPAIQAYIAELETYASSVTVHGCVRKALIVAEHIAQERDWRWLRRIACHLAIRRRPKNKRPRVVEVSRLYGLGFDLMNRAESEPTLSSFARALLYRDGLLIAVLAATVLRRGNLTMLELDRTLLRQSSGYLVHIPSRESKSGRLIEMPLPAELTSPMERFWKIHRPQFRDAGTHRYLWTSRHGGRLSDSQVFNIVTTRTEAALGHSVNPHLFRDCAITTLATHHGARIGAGVSLLGHRSPRITQKYYNQANMSSAVQSYQAILAHGQGPTQ